MARMAVLRPIRRSSLLTSLTSSELFSRNLWSIIMANGLSNGLSAIVMFRYIVKRRLKRNANAMESTPPLMARAFEVSSLVRRSLTPNAYLCDGVARGERGGTEGDILTRRRRETRPWRWASQHCARPAGCSFHRMVLVEQTSGERCLQIWIKSKLGRRREEAWGGHEVAWSMLQISAGRRLLKCGR